MNIRRNVVAISRATSRRALGKTTFCDGMAAISRHVGVLKFVLAGPVHLTLQARRVRPDESLAGQGERLRRRSVLTGVLAPNVFAIARVGPEWRPVTERAHVGSS
jgi:hypothetical protein